MGLSSADTALVHIDDASAHTASDLAGLTAQVVQRLGRDRAHTNGRLSDEAIEQFCVGQSAYIAALLRCLWTERTALFQTIREHFSAHPHPTPTALRRFIFEYGHRKIADKLTFSGGVGKDSEFCRLFDKQLTSVLDGIMCAFTVEKGIETWTEQPYRFVRHCGDRPLTFSVPWRQGAAGSGVESGLEFIKKLLNSMNTANGKKSPDLPQESAANNYLREHHVIVLGDFIQAIQGDLSAAVKYFKPPLPEALANKINHLIAKLPSALIPVSIDGPEGTVSTTTPGAIEEFFEHLLEEIIQAARAEDTDKTPEIGRNFPQLSERLYLHILRLAIQHKVDLTLGKDRTELNDRERRARDTILDTAAFLGYDHSINSILLQVAQERSWFRKILIRVFNSVSTNYIKKVETSYAGYDPKTMEAVDKLYNIVTLIVNLRKVANIYRRNNSRDDALILELVAVLTDQFHQWCFEMEVSIALDNTGDLAEILEAVLGALASANAIETWAENTKREIAANLELEETI